MFDFQATIDTADNYSKSGDFALATFHYWLINFAYEDEEFPYSYTEEIGARGRKGFLKNVKKHKNEILNSQSYLKYKTELSVFDSYKKYFVNFERVVNSFINPKKKNCSDDGDMYIGFPF